ncbi:MAG: group III truncated hemoglobin [Thiomonas sp.]
MKHTPTDGLPQQERGTSLFRRVLDATPDGVEPRDRRDVLARQLREQTGLDDAVLERLVRRFYAMAQQDAALGPLFAAHVGDWEMHYSRMVDFWASVGLLAGRYHRNALQAHRPLGLRSAHFARWLELFDQALQMEVSPQARAHLLVIAQRIAATLRSRLCTDDPAAQGALKLLAATKDTSPFQAP